MSACSDFIRQANLGAITDASSLSNSAFQAGQGCMNQKYQPCSDVCQNSTNEKCYACLSDANTCGTNAGTSSATIIQPCCPFVRSAVVCGRCLSQNPNNPAVCYSDGGGLNATTKWVLIGVGSAVGFVIIVALTIYFVRKRAKKNQQELSKQVQDSYSYSSSTNDDDDVRQPDNSREQQRVQELLAQGINPELIQQAIQS